MLLILYIFSVCYFCRTLYTTQFDIGMTQVEIHMHACERGICLSNFIHSGIEVAIVWDWHRCGFRLLVD